MELCCTWVSFTWCSAPCKWQLLLLTVWHTHEHAKLWKGQPPGTNHLGFLKEPFFIFTHPVFCILPYSYRLRLLPSTVTGPSEQKRNKSTNHYVVSFHELSIMCHHPTPFLSHLQELRYKTKQKICACYCPNQLWVVLPQNEVHFNHFI